MEKPGAWLSEEGLEFGLADGASLRERALDWMRGRALEFFRERVAELARLHGFASWLWVFPTRRPAGAAVAVTGEYFLTGA